jgi:EAL domain-containing protein (putative c-di-GMP-specific phosphodiesterase class I)
MGKSLQPPNSSAVRQSINTPPPANAPAATPAANEPVTAESLGWQLRAALPPIRLHSVSLCDEEANVLWLSEGALGPDEHNIVVEAIDALGKDSTLNVYETGIEDGRVAIFLPVRSPQGGLVGLAMILADIKSVNDNVLERLVTPQVRTIMQKVAVLLRPAPTSMRPVPSEAALQILELAPDAPQDATRGQATNGANGLKAAHAANGKAAVSPMSSGPAGAAAFSLAPSSPRAAASTAPLAKKPGSPGKPLSPPTLSAPPPVAPPVLSPQAVDDILEFELTPDLPTRAPLSHTQRIKTLSPSDVEVLAAAPAVSAVASAANVSPFPGTAPVTADSRVAVEARTVVDTPAAAPKNSSDAEDEFAIPAALMASAARNAAPIIAVPLNVVVVAPTASASSAAETIGGAGKLDSFNDTGKQHVGPNGVGLNGAGTSAVADSKTAAPNGSASGVFAAAVTAAPITVAPITGTPTTVMTPPAVDAVPTVNAAPAASQMQSDSTAGISSTISSKALSSSTTSTSKALPAASTGTSKALGAGATSTSRVLQLPDGITIILEVQPFTKLRAGGRTRRYEVLARSSHPGRTPAGLDNHALQRLLAWLGSNRAAWSLEPTSFTLNLSISTLEDERFPQFVASNLKAHGIAADNIGFEIAEPLCLQRRAQVERFITLCDRLGCFVVIDDFSLDSSLIGLLRSKALRLVKIDPKLTSVALKDKLSQAMVVAIAQAVKVLGIHCAAKRVDSQAQLQWLTAIGCDFAQGPAVAQLQPLESLSLQPAPAAN